MALSAPATSPANGNAIQHFAHLGKVDLRISPFVAAVIRPSVLMRCLRNHLHVAITACREGITEIVLNSSLSVFVASTIAPQSNPEEEPRFKVSVFLGPDPAFNDVPSEGLELTLVRAFVAAKLGVEPAKHAWVIGERSDGTTTCVPFVPLGAITITDDAMRWASPRQIAKALTRYRRGDWGIVSRRDHIRSEFAALRREGEVEGHYRIDSRFLRISTTFRNEPHTYMEMVLPQ